MNRNRKILLTALVILAALMILPSFAEEHTPQDHPEYDWIMIEQRRDSKGELCCGLHDCFQFDPRTMEKRPEGIYVPALGAVFRYEDHQVSSDGKFWGCVRLGVKDPAARGRCIFSPPAGT